MKNLLIMFSFGVIVFASSTFCWADVEALELYKTHCQQCHGALREGGVGPSLADGEWIITQPTATAIGKVIRDGSSNKAMPAWGSILTSAQIDALASWLAPGGATISTTPVIDTNAQLKKVRLPKDFSISIYADNLTNPRSMAVDTDDTVYVGSRKAGNIVALRDRNQDGVAETVIYVTKDLKDPTGVALHQGDLYVAETSRILRFKQVKAQLRQQQSFEVIKGDLPDKGWHGARAIEIGPDNRIYIPIGAPCNVCDVESAVFGKIWRMNLDGSDFELVVKGVRNSVGLAWHPLTQELWFTDNGRDELGDNSPSCELNFAPKKDMHFGFPYCHGGSVLDPEWGANKKCEQYTPPVVLLGPHVAPLGLSFYTAGQFPDIYKNQLFVAEHGSWNRTQKIGYRINLITLNGNALVSDTVFADFSDGEKPVGRPVDIAWLKDGSMLVSDDENGRIYRIRYVGEKPSLSNKIYNRVKSAL
jgi:glucose/arabinose dehydrogenase